MPQTKRKIGVSENGRPTRQKMPGSSSIHLLRSRYVWTNLDKRKTIRLKRYAALFTCFSSRAVHIEITNTIDADSFIMALHRFLVRRGSVWSIWLDNGTNFIGASNELKKVLKEIDHLKIKNYLQGNGTDWILWHKNPPGATYMGGVWERQIQTTRGILEG